jgi:hypothetical protein
MPLWGEGAQLAGKKGGKLVRTERRKRGGQGGTGDRGRGYGQRRWRGKGEGQAQRAGAGAGTGGVVHDLEEVGEERLGLAHAQVHYTGHDELHEVTDDARCVLRALQGNRLRHRINDQIENMDIRVFFYITR